MFGLISKKKLIRASKEIWYREDTRFASDAEDRAFRLGNLSAICCICDEFGVDIIKETRYNGKQEQKE